MTKVSNMYFGLSRLPPLPVGRRSGRGDPRVRGAAPDRCPRCASAARPSAGRGPWRAPGCDRPAGSARRARTRQARAGAGWGARVGRVEERRLALPAGGDETGTYLLLDQIRAAVRLRLVLGRGSFSAGVFLATGPGTRGAGTRRAALRRSAGGREVGCRGPPGSRTRRWVGVAAGHAVVDRSRAGAGAVLGGAHGDRDLDLAAEPAAERLGDGRAQSRLDHVTGEGVRDGEQSGVLDDRPEAGQPEVGTLLGGDDLVGEFVGSRGHTAAKSIAPATVRAPPRPASRSPLIRRPAATCHGPRGVAASGQACAVHRLSTTCAQTDCDRRPTMWGPAAPNDPLKRVHLPERSTALRGLARQRPAWSCPAAPSPPDAYRNRAR